MRRRKSNMLSIIGAGALSIVIILSILIICGLPLGELTMGGQYKVFPQKLRIVLVAQLILQVFFVLIILQMGEFIPLWFSYNVTKIIGIVMAIYLSLNTFMNLISKSKKEKSRGMGVILCLIDKKTYLRENLVALPIEYI